MVFMNPRNPAMNAIIFYIIIIIVLAIIKLKYLQNSKTFITVGVITCIVLYLLFSTISNSCSNKYLPKYS